MNVYLIRHGESLENITKNSGGLNSPLTPNGIKQAKAVAKRVRNLKISKIFSSDMLRAKQTSEIINHKLNLEISYTDLIREKKLPSMLLGKHETDPLYKSVLTEIQNNYHDKSYRHSDEDTFELFKKRVFEFMNILEKQKEENILVVAHGYTLRAIVGYVIFGMEFTSHDFVRLRDALLTKNTGLSLIQFEKNKKWKLLTWNDHAHLGE